MAVSKPVRDAVKALLADPRPPFRVLGRGTQATVYDLGEGLVAKVFTRPLTAAEQFLKMVTKGELSSPHFPKVTYAKGNVFVMERLKELDDETAPDWVWSQKPEEWASLGAPASVVQAGRELEAAGLQINDMMFNNVMLRDSTYILNDVIH